MNTLQQISVTGNLIEQVPNSDFAKFLGETIQLLESGPEILDMIEDDLDFKGKVKKAVRIEDFRYLERNFSKLLGHEFDCSDCEPISVNDLQLHQGRPRMSAMLVYLMMQVQGYLGSLTNQKNFDFLKESRTFSLLLEAYGWKFPGRSTINENLNKVSLETHEYILKRQIQFLIGLNLDDFKELTIDSTSVSADSKWPTDSGIILALLQRSYHLGQKLDRFETENLRPGWCPRWLKEIKQLDFQINCLSGRKRKVKRLYKQLLNKAEKFAAHLSREMERWNSNTDLHHLLPSKKAQVRTVIDVIAKDTTDVSRTILNARNRIFQGVSVKAKEKVLSISDPEAAFIKKGGREPVVGYKPQLVRSKQGFVVSLVLPPGSASDSGQFVPVIEQAIKNTGVLPHLVSADDGYSSQSARKYLLDKGVNIVNISGSKGKKIISDDDWNSDLYKEARRNRSAVESLMSIMKGCFGLGRMFVRGLDNVRRSMLQKALAYNFLRCIHWIENPIEQT